MGAPKGTMPPNAGKGRKRGSLNRATVGAREAIIRFVDHNTPNLQRWVNQVADGLKEPEKTLPDGTVVPAKWVVKPDPGRAVELVQSMLEYQLPKLSRSEVVKPDDEDNSRLIDSSQLTAEDREQLRQMILRQMNPALEHAQPIEQPGLGSATLDADG